MGLQVLLVSLCTAHLRLGQVRNRREKEQSHHWQRSYVPGRRQLGASAWTRASACTAHGGPAARKVRTSPLDGHVKKAFRHRHLSDSHRCIPKAWHSQAWAGVAQLVERKALNLVVKGSSPFFGDTVVLCAQTGLGVCLGLGMLGTKSPSI